LHSHSNIQKSNTRSQRQMNIQGSFLVCQKKPSRWFFDLRNTLQFGIGLHHAGLNDEDRSLVEELFANNKIQAFLFYLSKHDQQSQTHSMRRAKTLLLLIFACTLSLKQRVRRIMEGNRRMGMVFIDSSTGLIADFSCEVEITNLKCDKVLPCFSPSYWLLLYGLTSISLKLQELTNNAAEYARLWIGRGKRAECQGKMLRNDIN
ncbi:unnamed protein product, partial [Prunus brigantina]